MLFFALPLKPPSVVPAEVWDEIDGFEKLSLLASFTAKSNAQQTYRTICPIQIQNKKREIILYRSKLLFSFTF